MYTDTVSVSPLEIVPRHYGSAYAMSDYETKTYNMYLTASYIHSPKLNFHGTLGYNKSTADLDQVIFPDVMLLTGGDLSNMDYDFTAMPEYSNLDYEFLSLSLGFEYILAPDVSWTVDGEYIDLKDNAGYVYGDESGSLFMIRSGIRVGF